MILTLCSAFAFLVMVACNVLANALPIGGLNTGEVSALYPNYFVPAGYVFSIWGGIYLLLGVFVASRFLREERAAPYANRLNILFVISSLANAGWIFAWHHLQIGLSLIIIVVMLASLTMIYRTLARVSMSPKRAFYTRLPFQIYLGWISVAVIANAAALLVHRSWGGFGIPEPVWAFIMVLAAGILAAIMYRRHRDLAFLIVVVWAVTGIFIRQQNQPETANALLQVGTIAVPGALLLLAAVTILKRYPSLNLLRRLP